jgi:hypothetical protein
MKLLNILSWSGAALSFLVFILSILKAINNRKLLIIKSLPSDISVNELGKIESSIRDLCDVFVPCHQVERPHGLLLEAVESNMKRGVRYTFLVSQSRYSSEKDRYFRIFQAIAEMVVKEIGGISSLENLIRIRPLRGEWLNYPYVFYKTKKDINDLEATIVYRGTEEQRGICKAYKLVDSEIAPTIYSLLVNSTDWDEEMAKLFTLTKNEFITPEEYAKEKMK